MARCIASTRPSHDAWNGGSFGSGSILPKPSMPPMSWMPSIARPRALLLRVLGEPSADHGVARHQGGELLLAPAVRARGAHRQHEEAGLRGGVPHSDLGLLRQRDAEIGEHAARI